MANHSNGSFRWRASERRQIVPFDKDEERTHASSMRGISINIQLNQRSDNENSFVQRVARSEYFEVEVEL